MQVDIFEKIILRLLSIELDLAHLCCTKTLPYSDVHEYQRENFDHIKTITAAVTAIETSL